MRRIPGNSADSDSVAELVELARQFAAQRDWARFHTPRNVATALAVEAAELLEPFQWLTGKEADGKDLDPGTRKAVVEEIADVALYLLTLCGVLDVDLNSVVRDKMAINEQRWPADRETPATWRSRPRV